MTPIISARGLTKQFGRTMAVDHIDLDIPPGRIVGLIGPNGAGKTTALKAILGLATYEGELSVLGKDPSTQRASLMEDVCFWVALICRDFLSATPASASMTSSSAILPAFIRSLLSWRICEVIRTELFRKATIFWAR